MAEQYIYVMKDLRKIYPPNREVLKGIWLSFFPGAKIGVLGLNGAGKSTLLKIMAGEVKEFGGEAWAAKGAQGRLPLAGAAPRPEQGRARQRRGGGGRDPRPARQVRRDQRPLRRAHVRRGDGQADGRAGAGPGRRSRRRTPGRSTAPWRSPWTPCACPPPDAEVEQALGRRAAPRGPLPAAPPEARPAAPRRAHEPSRRRVGGLAGALPRRVPGHRGGRHPRPLLPRQRGGLDPGARPRPGDPLEGELFLLARAEARAPGAGGEVRVVPAPHPGARARVGAHVARAPARPRARPASTITRSSSPRTASTRSAPRPTRSTSPPDPGSATWWSRPRVSARGTATTCSSTTSRSPCRRAASWG